MKLGADVAAVDSLSRVVNDESQRLQTSLRTVDGMVATVWWQGPDADRFRSVRASNAISVNRNATALVRFPNLSRTNPAATGDTPLILSSASRISRICDSSPGVS